MEHDHQWIRSSMIVTTWAPDTPSSMAKAPGPTGLSGEDGTLAIHSTYPGPAEAAVLLNIYNHTNTSR